MKIENVRCEQFAGISDRNVEFKDGMNLLVGENESGKSTLADLIYSLFFQEIKVGSKKKEDKNFKKEFFPAEMTEQKCQADTIDGTICFSTEEGNFKLKKEWGEREDIRLWTPDGTLLKNEKQIQKILQEKLKYGKGIYDELVFSSQKRQQEAFEQLLSGKVNVPGAKMELASLVGKALMESGGVSIAQLEAKIEEKLDSYLLNWDLEADEPRDGKGKRGINNPWKQNVGKILEKYYELEREKNERDKVFGIEEQAEKAEAQWKEAENNWTKAKQALEQFQNIRAVLVERKNLEQLLNGTEEKLLRFNDISKKWPILQEEKEQAERLKKEWDAAAYRGLLAFQKEIAKMEGEIRKYPDSLEEDTKRAKELLEEIENKRAILRGMNISAKLILKNHKQAEIITANGEKVELSPSGEFHITEAVFLKIPDIMELSLSPEGIDVEEIMIEIKNREKEISDIYSFYHIDSYDNLWDLNEQRKTLLEIKKGREKNYRDELKQYDMKELQKNAENFQGTLRNKEEILADIKKLCETAAVEVYIAKRKPIIEDYEREFVSLEKLKAQIANLQQDQAKKREQIGLLGNIPEEYKKEDPEKLEKRLKEDVEDWEKKRKDTADQQSKAELEKEKLKYSSEQYEEGIKELEKKFDLCKKEYKHWKHIQEVFAEIKSSISQNPFGDIQDKFNWYLKQITNNHVYLEKCNEKMDITIASGKYMMEMEHLSEGTKDSIALAYRLAVLEHLYPNGDGIVVLDDPFTDMDLKRKEQSCRLLAEFAKKNQVIFLTCDKEYQKMFKECNVIFYSN